MNGDSYAGYDTLSPEQMRRLDEVCTSFEAAWKAGQRPRIEDCLGELPEERTALLNELIALEVEYRRRGSEQPQANEYLARFPTLDGAWLAGVFAPQSALKTLAVPQSTAEPTPAATVVAPERSRVIRVRCPNCHNPIQLAAAQSDEVLCPGCGSGFRLCDTEQTTTAGSMRQVGKFQLLERVGLGAFGAVWRARDTQLDRVVALKIPHAGLLSSSDDLERFSREARAAAQLRHPNIVTVHDVTTLEALPTIVLDFIEGVPLKDLLEVRPLTFPETTTLVADVADALHHAHEKGLIHRDLKPANIMVELGRPQTDGHLADAGTRNVDAADHVGKPVILDFGLALRGEAEITMTVDGQIIGTPAYMSPEQAAGCGHEVDCRSDVYSLGVILYRLLTGELPFRGSLAMLRHQVLYEEPRPPRKINEKIPRDLETICLRAMAKEPGRRFQTAAAMADDLRRFQHNEPIRSRPTPAWERAIRWIKRRPATAALLATAALITVTVLCGLFWWQHKHNLDREATARGVTAALAQAGLLHEEGLMQSEDPERSRLTLKSAQSALEHAQGLLDSGVSIAALSEEVAAMRGQLDQAERDMRLLVELDHILLEMSDLDQAVLKRDGPSRFAASFKAYGLDIQNVDPAVAGAWLHGHAHKERLLVAVLLWRGFAGQPDRERLLKVFNLAEPNPDSFLRRWQDAMDARDTKDASALLELANDESTWRRFPSFVIYSIVMSLVSRGERTAAVGLAQKAQQASPGDFLLNIALGAALLNAEPRQAEDGLRYLSAAVALRPKSSRAYAGLATALLHDDDLEGAIAAYRRAVELDAKFAMAYDRLGRVLAVSGKPDEALPYLRKAMELGSMDEPTIARVYSQIGIHCLEYPGKLDEAIALCRKAVELDAKDGEAHALLGHSLALQNKLDEALPHLQKGVELAPKVGWAHYYLGNGLAEQGNLKEAIASFRKAVELDPKDAEAHRNLGRALSSQSRFDEAIPHLRKAVELDPKDAWSHNKLGYALAEQGNLDEAITSYRKAIDLDPKYAVAHANLGHVLSHAPTALNKPDEAIRHLRTAVELDPKDAWAEYDLGYALAKQGKRDEAIAHFRQARELDANNPAANWQLAQALQKQGMFADAVDAFRRSHELALKLGGSPFRTAEALERAERLHALSRELPGFLKGDYRVKDNQERLDLAFVCYIKKWYVLCVQLHAEVFAAEPQRADDLTREHHRYNAACAAALASTGAGEDAGKLDNKERARLRQQALDWLRADLVTFQKLLKTGKPEDRRAIVQGMQHWQRDADLASLREAAALAMLPDKEQEAWRKLWADVQLLSQKARI